MLPTQPKNSIPRGADSICKGSTFTILKVPCSPMPSRLCFAKQAKRVLLPILGLQGASQSDCNPNDKLPYKVATSLEMLKVFSFEIQGCAWLSTASKVRACCSKKR